MQIITHVAYIHSSCPDETILCMNNAHDTFGNVFEATHEKGSPEWGVFSNVGDDKIEMYEVQAQRPISREEYLTYRRRFRP